MHFYHKIYINKNILGVIATEIMLNNVIFEAFEEGHSYIPPSKVMLVPTSCIYNVSQTSHITSPLLSLLASNFLTPQLHVVALRVCLTTSNQLKKALLPRLSPSPPDSYIIFLKLSSHIRSTCPPHFKINEFTLPLSSLVHPLAL